MFYLDKKSKLVLAACFIVLLCSVIYTYGYYHGATKDVVKESPTVQDDTPIPKDNRLGISAEIFIPNFNAYSSKHQILAYQHVYNDYIEFGNNLPTVIIVGKGRTDNLDYISVTFPKYDSKSLHDGKVSICATIYAVSPTTKERGRKLILEYLGLLEDVNSASGIKVFDYNGKRYSINYDGDDVSFIAMAIPQ